jgi:hypothetical protein
MTIEVLFLPWAGTIDFKEFAMGEPMDSFEIGCVKFGKFSALKKNEFFDPEIISELAKRIAMYKTEGGESVRDVLVCTPDTAKFEPFSPEHKRRILAAVDALRFAFIFENTVRRIACKDRNAWHIHSELFELISYQICLGDESVSIKSRFLSSYWPSFEDVTFHCPTSVSLPPLPPRIRIALALGAAFSSLASDGRHLQYNRMIQALEWFRLANSGADTLSEAARVVMMTTAIESLLGLKPGQSGGKAFGQSIRDRITSSSLCSKTITFKNKRGKPCEIQTHALAAWSSETLYKLRCDAVHGETVEPERFWFDGGRTILVLDVAIVVFGELILNDLFNAKMLGNILAPAYPQTSREQLSRTLFESQFRLQKLHEKLGWKDATPDIPDK